MRRKLLLAIGLAILALSVVAGSVSAQGDLLGSGEGGVDIDLPDGQNLDQVGNPPQCSNLSDDDGDGVTDLGDPDCSGPLDTSESGSSGVPNPPAPPTQPEPTPPSGGGGGGGAPPATDPSTGGGQSSGGPADSAQAQEDDRKGGNRRGNSNGGVEANRDPMEEPATRRPDGTPTDANPGLTIADFGPAPLGVPNFVIDQFTIPPFLLSIYQACGTQYGVDWQVLASINRIETAFGTNLNVSSAGALGWMQFMPATWEAYGVDANNDGRKDPYNPVDAICAAARYLDASGYENDVRGAIFAYNHADWYVDEVLLYANQYGKLPEALVSSVTGLTEGRFPVAANARYADDISERRALARSKPARLGMSGNAADVISGSTTRRGINIYTREGAPVVAVNDGVITKLGKSKKLGRYIVLRDAYGNRFTYAQLGEVSEVFPVPNRERLTAADFELASPREKKPAAAASTTKQKEAAPDSAPAAADPASGPVNTEDTRERLYALPERPRNVERANLTGQLDKLLSDELPGYESFKAYFSGVLRFDRKTMELRPLAEGSKVTAGTVLGKVGRSDDVAPRLHFAIRPAGRGAPKIDPKPILDGWKLLEATAIYRAAGENPLLDSASTGQVLLMSKPQLMRRVLADPRIEIYACGREDIRTGQIDRRVLALLAYLTERGFRLTVTSLKCGHSVYTSSGNISHHASGNAVDIAQINGMPVLGNQGRGSITEALVRDVMALQGSMAPDQIISLMDMGANTYAMGDHADHVHVGFTPLYGPGTAMGRGSVELTGMLKPDQWERLIEQIADIDNPEVPTSPSRYSLPAGKGAKKAKRASSAHLGE